jgi:hypothetical protein
LQAVPGSAGLILHAFSIPNYSSPADAVVNIGFYSLSNDRRVSESVLPIGQVADVTATECAVVRTVKATVALYDIPTLRMLAEIPIAERSPVLGGGVGVRFTRDGTSLQVVDGPRLAGDSEVILWSLQRR